MMSSVPEHRNPKDLNRIGCAPYNFVPLPEKIVLAHEDVSRVPALDGAGKRSDLYSGWFEVTLETRSPLFVRGPATLSGTTDEKNRPGFFHTGDPRNPVIPGTSLRGMLRGLTEIVSFSAVNRVTRNQMFFRSMDASSLAKKYRDRVQEKVETGFIRQVKGEWIIEPCMVARVKHEVLGIPPTQFTEWDGSGVRQGSEVSVRVEQVTTKDRSWLEVKSISGAPKSEAGWHRGIFHASGQIKGKKAEFVFLKPESNTNTPVIPVPDLVIDNFQSDFQLSQWQRRAFPKDKPARGCRPFDGWLQSSAERYVEPIFFIRDGGAVVVIGRARAMRIPHDHTPFDLIPKQLRSAVAGVDYADALFGWVGAESARKGRVSVSSAKLAEGQPLSPWLRAKPVVPRILGGPKPTAFQHYLTQPEPDNPKALRTFSEAPGQTTIRGHKLYWPQGDVGVAEIAEDPTKESLPPNDTQHTLMRPVRTGVTFSFKVRFSCLELHELGALCWALHPPGRASNNREEFVHRLGMGKPLGMGSVSLKPKLTIEDGGTRYRSLFGSSGFETGGLTPCEPGDGMFDKAVEEFEGRVCKDLGMPPGSKLDSHTRIDALLQMMRWPGHTAEKDKGPVLMNGTPNTRYLGLEEYKKRPVLPGPLPSRSDLHPAGHIAFVTEKPPVSPVPTVVKPGESKQAVQRAEGIDPSTVGNYLTGSIIAYQAGRGVIKLDSGGSLPFALADVKKFQASPRGQARPFGKDDPLEKGQSVECKVVERTESGFGATQITVMDF